jgi:hypothetical protein
MRPEDDQVERVLRVLDHPVPAISAESIAARARHRGIRRTGWTALILALATGGAVYAAPHSPVRSWVSALVEGNTRSVKVRAVPAAEVPTQPAAAGIAVAPGVGLVIVFGAPRKSGSLSGTVTVTLVDDAEVGVRAPRGAATFTTDIDRLGVERWDPDATFEVLVPRVAPRVEILIDGKRVFLKAGRAVLMPTVESEAGRYIIPLGTLGRSLPR